MKKIITLFIIFHIFLSLKSQNIECKGNLISIPLSGYKIGDIQWQFSNDSINWSDITGQTTTTLAYTLSETGYIRVQVSYGNCKYYSDTTFIEVYPSPTIANAGSDQYIITLDTIVTLDANTPLNGKGKWSIVSGEGGSFENDTLPNTTFKGFQYSNYILRWTTSTKCQDSYDDVNIGFNFQFPSPTNLNITSISENILQLNWEDNCNFEKGLKIERLINDSSYIEIAILDSNSTSYIDTALSTLNSYSYRVKAYTETHESDYSNTVKTSWKVSKDSLVNTLTGHSGIVWTVAFSPNGELMASGGGSGDGTVKIWNTFDWSVIHTFSGYEDIRCVRFSPNGEIFAASSAYRLKLWNVDDGSEIRTLDGGGFSLSCYFHPDSQYIIDGNASRKINIWNIDNGELVKELFGHPNTPWSVAINPDGTEIASGGIDDTYLRLWDFNNGSKIDSLNNNTDMIYNVAYSPDGKYIAVTTKEKKCNIWNNGNIEYSFSGSGISFKPNSNWLSIINSNNIQLFNVENGLSSHSISSDQSTICSVAFSSNNLIATGSYDKSIKIWLLTYSWEED